jgi:hypothetical protein
MSERKICMSTSSRHGYVHLALASLGRLALAVGLVATVVTLALGLGEAVVLVGGLWKDLLVCFKGFDESGD